MFIQSLPICYNQVHSLLSTDAASNQQVLDPEESISKIIIRAILRKIGVDVDLWNEYSLQRCHCKPKEGQDHDGKQLEGLGVAQGGSLFIQKIEKGAKGARVLSAVHICYDPSHQPFATEGAVRIEDLDSERSASKIIRAVIRSNGIGAASWESYSLHRCYCNSSTSIEDQHPEALTSESTLKELEIRDGESVFIRKIDDGLVEAKKEQSSVSRHSSKKRKERADDESLHSHSQKISTRVNSTSRKLKSTSNSSKSAAAVDKVSSNLENLSSRAAGTARSISKLLGGDGWKIQSIGKLGPIQTRGDKQLQGLGKLVKTSLEIPQISKSDRNGQFNSDLIEALTRAYHQRVGSSESIHRSFFDVGLSDYERANELLKGKTEPNGAWERSSISHLDQSALWKPASRFPLSDSGLSGQRLTTARSICVLWNNDKWLTQAPLPGLSPISLKDTSRNAILRQIAQLTRVKPGEATPDGFPPIVLRALQEAIKQRESKPLVDPAAAVGWSQSKDLATALEILKEELGSGGAASSSSSSTSIDSGNPKKRRTAAKPHQ